MFRITGEIASLNDLQELKGQVLGTHGAIYASYEYGCLMLNNYHVCRSTPVDTQMINKFKAFTVIRTLMALHEYQ